MVNRLIAIVTLAVAACFFVVGANAQLVPITSGFPTIVQSNNAVAFSQDTANAVNFQDASVTFPTLGGGLPFGGLGIAFPSIQQTSLQTQSVTHTEFSQTNSFAEFAFPFTGVGATGLPGFGFGL